jgi:hypothetical protein
MNTFTKDPDAILDYTFDWSEWLGTDTISTSTFTLTSGITKDSDSKTTTTTTIWLSGGTSGSTYLVTNRIVTVGGRTEDRSIMIEVRSR